MPIWQAGEMRNSAGHTHQQCAVEPRYGRVRRRDGGRSAANGAVYRRYCDDVLVMCRKSAFEVEESVKERIKDEKMMLNEGNDDRHVFDGSEEGVPSNTGLSCPLRGPGGSRSKPPMAKASPQRPEDFTRRRGRDCRGKGEQDLHEGAAPAVCRLEREGRQAVRNLSSYARRSADALESKAVLQQVRRLEKSLEREIAKVPKSK